MLTRIPQAFSLCLGLQECLAQLRKKLGRTLCSLDSTRPSSVRSFSTETTIISLERLI